MKGTAMSKKAAGEHADHAAKAHIDEHGKK
jgi:hypothetical protein